MAKSPLQRLDPSSVPTPDDTPISEMLVSAPQQITSIEIHREAIRVGLLAILQHASVGIAGVTNKHAYVRSLIGQVYAFAEIAREEWVRANGNDN